MLAVEVGATLGGQWTLIGPLATDNAIGGNVHTSGHVEALAVDPRDANTVYLGAATGGVWKTTDGGQHWAPLTDAQPSLVIGSIALDPSNPDIVYAGTGSDSSLGFYGAGILKSTDGGASWTHYSGPFVGGGLGGAAINGLAVNPANGQILLAAVADCCTPGPTDGLFRSSDGGKTWMEVLAHQASPGVQVLFDPTNGSIAYAALGISPPGQYVQFNGVYKSTDSGQTWNPNDGTGQNVLPLANAGRISLAIARTNPSTLYASIANGTSSQLLGLFKTSDGGMNWTQLTNIRNYLVQGAWANAIAVDPTNADIVFAAGTPVERSTDGGATWTEVATGASLHGDHHALAFSSDGTTLYDGNDGGAWKTTNITTSPVVWTNINTTLAITEADSRVSVNPLDLNSAIWGTQDNGTQLYTGNLSWEYVVCGDGSQTAIDFEWSSTLYASCFGTNINKSTSAGLINTWTEVSSGIDSSDRSSFPPLVMDPSNPQTLYFGTFRAYQTVNGAVSWNAISPDLTTGAPQTVSAIAVAPNDSNTVYAGTTDGHVQVTGNAGSGAGALWTNISTGLPARSLTQIAVDPPDALTAFATFSGFTGFPDSLGHVFMSKDGGPWIDISGNLPNIPVNDIVVDPDVPGTLYVATDVGAFGTSDGGVSWSPLGSGLPNVIVFGLTLQRRSRLLFAATRGRSVWDLQLSATSSPTLSPTSLTFPNQASGTASPPQTATLSYTGTGLLAINSIATSGAFAQTNNCGGSLAAATSCSINVTFAPTALGMATGTLSISDNAPGSPQMVTLAGNGLAPSNPVPTLALLSRAAAPPGSAGFNMTVIGADFISTSVVRWNGADLPTTFVSSTELTASVPSIDFILPGSAQVTVFNPAPGGGTSNALTFNVTAAASTAVPTGAYETYIPHSAYGAGWITRLFVANLTNASNTVTINRMDQTGAVVASQAVTLGPAAMIQLADSESTRALPLTINWFAIGSQGPVIASVLFDFQGAAASTPANYNTAIGALASPPLVAFTAIARVTSPGGDLGLALANLNNASNTVTIKLYDEGGNLVAQDSVTLGPFAQTAFDLTQAAAFKDILASTNEFVGTLTATTSDPTKPVSALVVGANLNQLFSLPVVSGVAQ
jgi:photosystem II stability/assembly factor-like uncharacterized protein